MVVSLNCVYCGDEFEVRETRQDEAKYCSQGCFGKHQSEKSKVTRSCPSCGENFSTTESQDQKYCSRECNIESQKKRIEVECANCGETLERIQARIERSENHFCDAACMGEWCSDHRVGENHPNYVAPIETECKACGTAVERMEHYAKRHDTYCEDCRESLDTPASSETRTVERECDWCGDTFEVAYYHADHARFCDDECYGAWKSENYSAEGNPNYNGGPTVYAPGFTKEYRSEIRERDEFECQDCGLSQEQHLKKRGRRLHVHHIQKAKTFDSDDERMHDEGNLITLCKTCHDEWEKISPLKPM